MVGWGFNNGDWLRVEGDFGDGDPLPDGVVDEVEEANVMGSNK